MHYLLLPAAVNGNVRQLTLSIDYAMPCYIDVGTYTKFHFSRWRCNRCFSKHVSSYLGQHVDRNNCWHYQRDWIQLYYGKLINNIRLCFIKSCYKRLLNRLLTTVDYKRLILLYGVRTALTQDQYLVGKQQYVLYFCNFIYNLKEVFSKN